MRHHGNDEMSAAAVWDAASYDDPSSTPMRFATSGQWQKKLSRRLAGYVVTKRVWARNERPLVSITFDDVPEETFIHGAPLLEGLGVRGTFYIAGGLCGATDMDRRIISAADCVELHRRGHEIGCHTFSHVPVSSLDEAAMAAELERNQAFFASLVPGLRLENFAYPFGSISVSRKLQVQQRFHSCRGVREEVNVGDIDLGMLKAVPMDQSTGLSNITEAVDETVRCKGWLIVYTHDIAPAPTRIGCQPGFLGAVVEHALRRRCDVVTVREGLRLVGSQVGLASR